MSIRTLAKYYTNFKGWRTNRKIIVIESDDWGSIRMPSKEVYQNCLKNGYRVDNNVYERYDSLASEQDLELLFDLLKSFKDKHGNSPIITANCMVTNPDFKKIREDNFERYHYELISETFKSYPNHANSLSLWKKGSEEGVFYPQCHGREHVNVSLLMDALQRKDEDVLFGFNNKMPGCISKGGLRAGNVYVEAMKANSSSDKKEKLEIFKEALDIFKDTFGYKSYTLTPPNYVWSPDYNSEVLKKGVKFIQGIRKYIEPVDGQKNKHHRVYLGMKSEGGPQFLVRNVTFEPSIYSATEEKNIDKCLREIKIAFDMKKPAIISSHRINYVGYLVTENRDKSLVMLRKIIKSALKKWPDIEFMTSEQLGKLMEIKETS